MTSFADEPTHRDVRPPTWPFGLSVLAFLASAALAIMAPGSAHLLRWSIIGWAAGAVAPLVLLVYYRMRDRSQRARSDYTVTAFGNARMTALAVLGAVAGGFNSWTAATWLAS